MEHTPSDRNEDRLESAGSGRYRLLQAASREFSEVGFAAASISSIAGRAGVSKSTVFHHFSSKDELYLEVVRQAAQDFGQQLDAVLSLSQAPDATLKQFQSSHLAHIERNGEVARLVLRELMEPANPRAVALARDVLGANFSRLVRYLSDAREKGLIRQDVDPASAALLMLSANVLFFQAGQVLGHLPGFALAGQPQAWADGVIDLLFKGLRA